MATPVETRKFAREQAGRLLGRLAYQVNHTIKTYDSAAVHDLRAAIRRYTRALKVFDSLFEIKETRKLRHRLKRVLELAREVGRLDVALRILAKAPGDAGALRGKIQARRKEAVRDLATALKRWIDRKSSMKWRAALEVAMMRQKDVLRGVPLERTASETLESMARDFFHAGNEAAAAKNAPEVLEDFRVACRKFRYTLEVFAPVSGAEGRLWLEKVYASQVLLGKMRDWGVAEAVISPYKGTGDLTDWIKKRRRKQGEEFRSYWHEEFGDARSVRSWIEGLAASGPGSRVPKKPAGRSMSVSSRAAAAQGREKISLPSSR